MKRELGARARLDIDLILSTSGERFGQDRLGWGPRSRPPDSHPNGTRYLLLPGLHPPARYGQRAGGPLGSGAAAEKILLLV